MATDMAMSFSHNMTGVNFSHGYPLHHHHQMDGFDYYTQQRNYQSHVMATNEGHQVDGIVDEDDYSDNESMFTSADMDSDVASDDLADAEPNVADRLLEFAETVNRDIQKYFGRKKSTYEPESIGTIYEDRFATGKSGRELYYADLLRVAQNGDTAEPHMTGRSRKSDASISPHTIVYNNVEGSDMTYSCTNELGPLKELFDFAVGCSNKNLNIDITEAHLQHGENTTNTLPWRKRALPNSFFVEPVSRVTACTYASGSISCHSNNVISVHGTPDFSDLVANFTSDYDHRMTPTVDSQ